MKEIKELVCVNCPMGCLVKVELEDGVIQSIQGNSCPKGKEYAQSETIRPMRILTSTVLVEHGFHRVVPVITKEAIPLDMMDEAMEEVRKLKVEAPVTVGQVIKENLANTGVCLLASRSLKRAEE